MQYLVRGRFLDNPAASPMEIVGLWEKYIHPSHEMLEKMVNDKKIMGVAFLLNAR